MRKLSLQFMLLCLVAGALNANAHDNESTTPNSSECKHLLDRIVLTRSELVHPELRQIFMFKEEPNSLMLRLFLLMQHRPKFTDLDFYFLLKKMGHGATLRLSSGQKELMESVQLMDRAAQIRSETVDPKSVQTVEINVLYLAMRAVREISRPDLWPHAHTMVLERITTSAEWNQYSPAHKAGIIAAFYALIDRP